MAPEPQKLPPPSGPQKIIAWLCIACFGAGAVLMILVRTGNSGSVPYALPMSVALIFGPLVLAYASAKRRAKSDPLFAERMAAVQESARAKRPAVMRRTLIRVAVIFAVAAVAYLVRHQPR